MLKSSKSEKCSESRGIIFVLWKYFLFLKICPAETIASLVTIPRLSVLIIILSKKYKDLYPEIASKLKSDRLDTK